MVTNSARMSVRNHQLLNNADTQLHAEVNNTNYNDVRPNNRGKSTNYKSNAPPRKPHRLSFPY